MKIQELLGHAYNRDKWLNALNEILNIKALLVPLRTDNQAVQTFSRLGSAKLADNTTLGIYEIKLHPETQLRPKTQLRRNRVQMRNLVAKACEGQGYDGALAVYFDGGGRQWRFSFIAIEFRMDERGNITTEQTASRRYTYLLGKNSNTRTAKERFGKLDKTSTLEQLKAAFAVETLSKEFYDKLFQWYEHAKTQVVFPNDEGNEENTHISVSLIRLLTRLLFVWFIKQKELINPDLFDCAAMQGRIDWEKDSSYYKAILQNLFFATLNREINDRSFSGSHSHFVTNVFRYQKKDKTPLFTIDDNEIKELFEQTPFLNGGLFECLDRELSEDDKDRYPKHLQNSGIRIDGFSGNSKNPLRVPNDLFFNNNEDRPGLINLFNQYQFTVEESTPLDVEVALDPELLGKVFENLLASYNPETQQVAKNATGSFYTPREIVGYMVDESLKAYLLQAAPPRDGDTTAYQNRLQDLFSASDKTGALKTEAGTRPVYDKEIPALINAIGNIKILDPAVGSGAFPMGVLQRLVALLKILDPNNKHWEQQQLDIAKQNFTDPASLEQAKRDIESIFSKQNDYGRKLYLIERSIYGVDIQAIAAQIAKLRFFISLVIEQQPNEDKTNNYGIKPLPNLETNFITADSLISLGEMPDQQDLFDRTLITMKEDLFDIRHRYFAAKTLKTKRKYREEDVGKRKAIAKRIKQTPGATSAMKENAEKIAAWDLYNQNAVAKWFSSEWMFGIKGGFSVVIGNPPYIQLQKDGGRLGRLYQSEGFVTFAGSGDIYQLFYEKGHRLLSKNGHCCFITSNKWMRARYGERLREYLACKTQPVKLLDLGSDVFEDATVDTNILLFGNEVNSQHQQVQAVAVKHQVTSLATVELAPLPLPTMGASWIITRPIEQRLMDKINEQSTQLKDWDVKIFRGVLTGCIDAFIIDEAKRDELIDADPNSEKIIKPVLRGKDIQRYQTKLTNLYLITTFPTLRLDIEDYQAVKKYLLGFGKNKLEQSGKKFSDGTVARKKTSHQWFEIQDTIRYYQEFAKEKIIWGSMAVKPKFALDPHRLFCASPANLLTGNFLKYILGFLNSQFCYYQMRRLAYSRAQGYMEYLKVFVEQILIPKANDANRSATQQIETLVDQIHTAKNQTPSTDTSDMESQIDQLVYQLYDLTADEISVIEGSKQ